MYTHRDYSIPKHLWGSGEGGGYIHIQKITKCAHACKTSHYSNLKSMPLTDICYVIPALMQFKYQATNRLLLAASEEYGDSGTTQKKDVKTPAKMLPSTLHKHCMCTITMASKFES